MKLSRVYTSLEQIPEHLREYYIPDGTNRYILQVEGMVSKKELKQFRDNNIESLKKIGKLEEENYKLQGEIEKLKDITQKDEEAAQNEKSGLKANTDEYTHFTKIVNTYKKHSILKRIKSIKDTIEPEEVDRNNFIINGTNIRITGKFIRTGQLKSESYIDLEDPELIIDILKRENKGIDIFTFIQPIQNSEPIYENYFEMDNLAAIPITTFENWWHSQIKDKTRNLIRKAEKNNVIVKQVPLNDVLIQGIQTIFNETPFRQGRPYHHYGKDFDRIKKEISTFPDNSDFIGAYYENELIGFIKIVYKERCASLMQILSMSKDRDKAPTNAMLAKAVELTANNHVDFLIYRKFVYGKKGVDELTEFKINNGFQRFDIPRYFIPLTLKGKIALSLKLHKDTLELLPSFLYSKLVRLRNYAYYKKYQRHQVKDL